MTSRIRGPDGGTDALLPVKDLSLGGLSFQSSRAWPEGGTVKVQVNADAPYELEATVRRCTERRRRWFSLFEPTGSRRLYDVGVEFLEAGSARCREAVDQMFLSETYQRGLCV